MHKFSLIVPQSDNDGTPISHELRLKVENDLLKEYGGFSMVEQEGLWVEDGKTYWDEAIRYEVITDKPSTVVLKLAKEVAIGLNQESVAVIMSSVEDFILVRQDDTYFEKVK